MNPAVFWVMIRKIVRLGGRDTLRLSSSWNTSASVMETVTRASASRIARSLSRTSNRTTSREVVAHEDGGVVAPLRVGRRPSATERRLVDDVVVDERRRVKSSTAQPGDTRALAARAGGRASEEQEDRSQPLAARPRDVPPICWISSTGESSSLRIGFSTASRSPRPAARRVPSADRSRVGVATRRATSRPRGP